MSEREVPTVAIVGKKNSGKTTLVVALARELGSRGFRIASLKHGHHAFEIDQPGTDSWRHFNEGCVEAVIFTAADRLALVMRHPGSEPDPRSLIGDFFAGRGYDLVLVEGYKHGPFPKIEVFRKGVHEHPVYDPADPVAAALFLAIVTDDADLTASCPIIPLDPAEADGRHVAALADLLTDMLPRPALGS